MKKVLSYFERSILSVGLTIMTFITVINVISRKYFGLSLSFLEELTTAMFILITLIGAASAAKYGGHLGLSAFTDLLPKRNQKYIIITTWIISIIFSVALIKFGIEMVQSEIKMGITTPALGWPEAIFGSFIPLGGIFILIRFSEWAINSIKQLSKEGN